jgi:L-rhamnose mutarotase
MPSPECYIDKPVSKQEVITLFSQAESSLKKLERTCGETLIAAINQLRYAGHHLAKFIDRQENKELEKVANHCKRALYDIYEAGILFYLKEFEGFNVDYAKVNKSDVLPDWIKYLQKIKEIKEFIIDRNNYKKTIQDNDIENESFNLLNTSHVECAEKLEVLKDICYTLDVAREELNLKINKERKVFIIGWLAILATLLGILVTLVIK